MHEYGKHLQERHKCKLSTSPRSLAVTGIDATNFTKRYKWEDDRPEVWPLGAIESFGKTFLLHGGRVPADVAFHTWVTVLASPEVAHGFMFEFKLMKKLESGRRIEASWTMPVVAYYDQPKYTKDLPFYVTVPAVTLREFCQQLNLNAADESDLQFVSSYHIFKIN
ncbi:hypothetical protein Fcan01_11266 [Folsomia candida]|uniref:Uncharacterized protein n=1 Tax=Folsomia candida TaxID=158441 RepID=A0A226EE95_FOLCA|nr:hypothetical protein Fcan01_11266 [Folsomia candida]